MANWTNAEAHGFLESASPILLDMIRSNKNSMSLSLLAVLLGFLCLKWLRPSPFRMINGKRLGELTNIRAKKEFMVGAQGLIAKGLEMVPGKPFRIMGDVGEIFILPPNYAHEIRNHEQLSFTMAAFKVRC